jgi:hypothetical protein
MFSLVQVTNIARDGTCGYVVELEKQYTVQEFIETILSQCTNEWGYVGIKCPPYVFGNPRLEYKYGKITTKPFNDDVLDKTIEKVTASGGWTRMDYIITTDKSLLL